MSERENAAGNANFFDKLYFSSKNYFRGYENYDQNGFWNPIVKTINKYFPDPSSKSLLEVGAAYGYLLKRLTFGKKVGLDISPYALDRAKKDNVVLVQGKAETLPFPDHNFDCIVGLDVVEHTGNFGETIMEFSRVLKEGGIMVIGTPITSTTEGKIWGKFLDRDASHVSKPSWSEIQKSLSDAGLELLERHYYFPLPGRKIPFPRTNIEIVARKKA